MKEKYEELKFQDSNNNSSTFVNADNEKNNEQKNKKEYTIFADLKKKIIPADNEVNAYLQLEEIDLEADPFAW